MCRENFAREKEKAFPPTARGEDKKSLRGTTRISRRKAGHSFAPITVCCRDGLQKPLTRPAPKGNASSRNRAAFSLWHALSVGFAYLDLAAFFIAFLTFHSIAHLFEKCKFFPQVVAARSQKKLSCPRRIKSDLFTNCDCIRWNFLLYCYNVAMKSARRAPAAAV